MNYTIDPTGHTPAYIQLYYQLRRDIVEGTYPYKSRLPSKRILAEETSVSVITIEHSMELLVEEGYIEARPRSGYYVIFRKSDFVGVPQVTASAPVEPADVPEQGKFPYTVYASTARRVLLDYGERVLQRAPNQGCLELREAICAYLARSRSIHVKPSQIVIGSGAEYLYGLIAQLFGRNTIFALESPSYEKIFQVYTALGITCDMLPLMENGIESAALSNTEAAVLHTTPFHSYPSGISADGTKKHEYLAWARKRNGIIIEDNYDSEMTVSSKAEDSLFAMSNGENVIYLNTFSRTIAPSVRVGYMVLPLNWMELFQEKLGFYTCTVPVFTQLMITELLQNGDLERHINRVRRQKRKQQK